MHRFAASIAARARLRVRLFAALVVIAQSFALAGIGALAAPTSASAQTVPDGPLLRCAAFNSRTNQYFWPSLEDGYFVVGVTKSAACLGGLAVPGQEINGVFITNQPKDNQGWCRDLQRALFNAPNPPAGFRAAPLAGDGYTLACDPQQSRIGRFRNTQVLECLEERCIDAELAMPMVNGASFGASYAYGETEKRDGGGGVWTGSPGSIVSAFAAFPKTPPTQLTTACDPRVGNELAGFALVIRDHAGVERRACMLFVRTELTDDNSYRSLRFPGQINFVLPPQMTLNPDPASDKGLTAILIRRSDNKAVNVGEIPVRSASPGLFMVGNPVPERFAAAYLTRVKPNPVAGQPPIIVNEPIDKPIDIGNPAEEVYLVLYGTGWRGYPAAAGADRAKGAVKASLVPSGKTWSSFERRGASRPSIPQEIAQQVVWAGAQPEYLGLDQINIRLSTEALRNLNLRTDTYAGVVVTIDPAFDAGVKPGDDGRADRTSNSVDIIIKALPPAAEQQGRSRRALR